VAVRNANPEGVIIGEEWGNASRWLLGREWDSVMNYRLRRGILGFVRDDAYMDNDANGDNVIHALKPSELDRLIRDIESDYPPVAYHAMMNILGSHDTSRLGFVAGSDERQKLAALIVFALPGTPTIYYGDEIGLDAPSVDDNGTLQDDPYNRAPYPWPDAAGDTSARRTRICWPSTRRFQPCATIIPRCAKAR
jgi:glycosidase